MQLRLVAAHPCPLTGLTVATTRPPVDRRRLVHHPSDETLEVDLVHPHGRCRLLGCRDEQQFFDQPAEPLAVVDGAVEQLRHDARRPTGCPSRLIVSIVPDDRGHRCAQLVRDGRHELAFLAVQVELLAVGLVDLLVEAGVRHRQVGLRCEPSEHLDPLRSRPSSGRRS